MLYCKISRFEVVIIKTLIELFDSCQTENVVAGLRFLPKKIVFVGFKEVMTKKRLRDLNKFFELRNINIEIECEIVGRYDYDAICNKLNEIIDRNEDCCFDLTGGKELVLTAMGDVSAVRNIPMFQFNVRTGELIRVKNCDDIAEPEKASMTVNECVLLNGGAVVSDGGADFNWDLNGDFKKDIDTIWEICKENCGLWNRQATVFDSFERFGTVDDGCRVTVNLRKMRETGHDTLLDTELVSELVRRGLLTECSITENVLTYTYKNDQVRQCISKAGNILELYVYKTAKEIAETEPGFYDDIDIGVFVDWDGVVHDSTSKERDTRNEIDVILMRDLVPVFISCKNGEVHKEALYELSIMAERFGGEYARKILLTSYVNTDSDSKKYLLQRASDMGIKVIDGVDKMSKEEFAGELKSKAK